MCLERCLLQTNLTPVYGRDWCNKQTYYCRCIYVIVFTLRIFMELVIVRDAHTCLHVRKQLCVKVFVWMYNIKETRHKKITL